MERAIIWFVAAILVLTVLLSLVGNVNVKFIVPPPAQSYNYKKLTIPSSEIIEYMNHLPTTINSSSLTAYFPQYILISSGSGNDILNNVLHVLSMNASVVAPGPYWEVADLAGFLQAHLTTNKSYLIVITNGANVTYYNMTLPFFSASPLNVSYPPSDNTSVHTASFVINSSTNYAYLEANILSYHTQIISERTYHGGYSFGNYSVTWVTRVYTYRYDATVSFHVYYDSTYTNVSFDRGFSGYFDASTTCVTYKDGNHVTHRCFSYVGSDSTNVFYQYKHEVPGGIYTFRPGAHLIFSLSVSWYPIYSYFTEYEYEVKSVITINVYNGTSPVTSITWNNGTIFSGNRSINIDVNFKEWAINPVQITINATTFDKILNITRAWHAVEGEISSQQIVYENETENAVYVEDRLNISNDFLIAKQPSWVFNHVPASEVYSHNYADEFVNGPAYYYALARVLLNNFTTYQLFEIVHSIQSQLIITNTSWAKPVDALKYGNGSLMDIYYQIMPSLFTTQYHNFTYQNNSVLIGAFNINTTINPIIIENKTVSLNGVNIDSLYKNAYANISTILRNGTYTFFEWPNYGSPPILFESYPVGNYSVEFLL